MRKNIVAANWKMYFSIGEAQSVAERIAEVVDNKTEVIVCPPFVFLDRLSEVFLDTPIKLGAQNMYFEEKGAFTGEISPVMLKSVGSEYVILGHSERRHIFGEGDIDIHKKVVSAIEHGLKPILCVGETLAQRKDDKAKDVVERQIITALDGVDLSGVVVAYEPVWAIGTGVPADLNTVSEMHTFIRGLVEGVPILYGGSVKDKNAYELAQINDVDGFLVGSASLDTDTFKKIIDEFERAKGVN